MALSPINPSSQPSPEQIQQMVDALTGAPGRGQDIKLGRRSEAKLLQQMKEQIAAAEQAKRAAMEQRILQERQQVAFQTWGGRPYLYPNNDFRYAESFYFEPSKAEPTKKAKAPVAATDRTLFEIAVIKRSDDSVEKTSLIAATEEEARFEIVRGLPAGSKANDYEIVVTDTTPLKPSGKKSS